MLTWSFNKTFLAMSTDKKKMNLYEKLVRKAGEFNEKYNCLVLII